MNLAASYGPGCEQTTMTCKVSPITPGLPATDILIEIKVGPVSPATCDKPNIIASTTCPLPSHADPKSHAPNVVQLSDLPQQAQIPMHLNGAELGVLKTDDFGKPSPDQCWRMPLPPVR